MEYVSHADLALLNRFVAGDPIRALEMLGEYERRFTGDPNFDENCGAFYIDIGTLLLRRDLVERGIQRLERIVEKPSRDAHPNLLYNIGNGYHTLGNLDLQEKGHRFDPDKTPLEQAKLWYRRALASGVELDHDLRCQLWVNYGNCLSALGRAVETVAAFNRALRANPEHAMAMGNLGMELIRFANAAERGKYLFDGIEMLDKALDAHSLTEYGGNEQARTIFKGSREHTVEIIKRMGFKRAEPRVGHQSKTKRRVDEYASFCAEHELFLNFCLHCRKCKSYAKDGFALSLVTDIDDRTHAIRLFRMVNEIRESYAFARYQFYQSQSPLLKTTEIGNMTPYSDNLDYGVYGIRIATLKSAFETAYGVFDKIAYFLNEYLSLGINPETRIAFTTNGRIWNEQSGEPLREALRELNNYYLFALYGIARDLDITPGNSNQDTYFGRLRRTRNRLSHEYVVPHIEEMHWDVDADKPDCHMLYPELVNETLTLLTLVKASVIYLVCFIRQEECRRHPINDERIFKIEAEAYDARLFGAALDFRDGASGIEPLL